MRTLTPPSVEALIAAMRQRGWVVFNGKRRPDLNLVGLRNAHGTLDEFDDLVVAFWFDGSTWQMRSWRATLDPGKPVIDHPKRRDGTAVMAEAQTRGALKIGMHHEQYRCLVPAKPIPVLRYKSAEDYAAGRGVPSTSSSTQIHHASSTHVSTVVGPWSEGCGVVADSNEFDGKSNPESLMGLCDRSIRAGNGDTFTWSVMSWPL